MRRPCDVDANPDNCRTCGLPWWRHTVHHDEPPPEAVEGDFGGTWSGLYCRADKG